MDNRITNAEGKVAMKYRTSNPRTVLVQATGRTYNFSTANPDAHTVFCNYLSMAWVDPADIDALLRVIEKTCCGKRGNAFSFANQLDVNLWTTGNRYGTQS